jgi:hypothetical protein
VSIMAQFPLVDRREGWSGSMVPGSGRVNGGHRRKATCGGFTKRSPERGGAGVHLYLIKAGCSCREWWVTRGRGGSVLIGWSRLWPQVRPAVRIEPRAYRQGLRGTHRWRRQALGFLPRGGGQAPRQSPGDVGCGWRCSAMPWPPRPRGLPRAPRFIYCQGCLSLGTAPATTVKPGGAQPRGVGVQPMGQIGQRNPKTRPRDEQAAAPFDDQLRF